MNKLLQPADMEWFRSMKSDYYQKWNDWYSFDKKNQEREISLNIETKMASKPKSNKSKNKNQG
jgi:hypothetical protein